MVDQTNLESAAGVGRARESSDAMLEVEDCYKDTAAVNERLER